MQNLIYWLLFLLVGAVVYLGFAAFIGKTISRKAKQKTWPPVTPLPMPETLPTVTERKPEKKYKEGLVLGNQRQRRKKMRQSKYLFLKYGK